MSKSIGIVPTEYKVLVELMEEAEQTNGGLFLPPSTIDRQEMAREIGIFVSAGAMAFNMNDPTATPWPVYPKQGDKVYFDRYAGTIITLKGEQGKKGKRYRLLNDKNIAAIITTEIE